MPTNPNDIAKILNEMTKTLQELSDKELDSVESIFQGYKKTLENSKKIEESRKQLEDLEKKELLKEKKENKEEEKRLNFKKNLTSVIGKANSKIHSLFDFSNLKKQMNPMVHVKDFIQEERQKFSSYFNIMKPKQSSEDFSRKETEDVQFLQLKLLKEIDSKIGKLTTTSSGGLFDSIFSSIKGLFGNLGSVGGIAEALGVGTAGAGATGLLGKYGGKLLSGLGKAGKGIGGLVAKNPKAAAITLAATAIGGGAYSMFGGDDEEKTDTLQTRKVGGRVGRNDMYLVGENGPELFSPKQNGYIIPNNKLKNNEQNPEDDFRKTLKKSVLLIMNKMSGSFVDFDKVIIQKFRDVYSYIKDWIKGKIDNVKDSVMSIPKNIFSTIKGFIKPEEKKKTEVVQGDSIKPEEKKTEVVQGDSIKLPEMTQTQSSVNISPSPITNQISFGDVKEEPIQLQSVVNIPQSVPAIDQSISESISKEFWMNKFLPKFVEGIKKKKDQTNVRSNPIPSVYLGY